MRRQTSILSCMVLIVASAFVSCSKKEEPGVGSTDPGEVEGSVGSVSFTYRAKPVTYATVRAKDGNIWLQQNLGATKVASSLSDADAYGDFFQWGRWDDGHQVRNPAPPIAPASSLTANNPSGLTKSGNSPYIANWWIDGASNDQWTTRTPAETTPTVSCDPCRAVGENWRMPSPTEWNALLQAESITNSVTAFASTLKIPTSGWRATFDTSILGEGWDSWFWTRQAGNEGYALGVWIRSGSVLKDYNDLRAYGTSVRCVKKQE